MRKKLTETINTENPNIIIDGHYASAVTPTEHVATFLFCGETPKNSKFMEKCG